MDERHVSNVTHASLTFLRNFHARGARLLGRRAVRRDTRLDSVRLRHRRRLSSSQGLKGLKKLLSHLGQPRERLLVALAITDLSRLLASRQLREVFLVCVFGCRCCWVFLLCYSVHFGLLLPCTDRVLRWNISREEIPGNVQTEISISGALVVPRASQRKRITNIARDGEGVRGVPRSVALRRRRVKVGSSGDHLMPPSKPFSRHARRRSGVVFFPNDDEVL